jgi:anti-sigma regulatory factor (Ser/Thr protein kinase)
MKLTIVRQEIRDENDVVHARQVSREIAARLGFAPIEQTRLATAVSEGRSASRSKAPGRNG